MAPKGMSELRAALYAAYGQPDVIVRVEDALENLATWLPEYFMEEAGRGVRFAPDQTIQIGWSVLKLSVDAVGDLLVCEPDFVSMPIKWVEGASQCVRLLALQRSICEELGVEPEFPWLGQPAFVPDAQASSGDFMMMRAEEGSHHSGWSIQEREDTALKLVSLYEATLSNRAIVPFLALPRGSLVKREGAGYFVSSDGRQASSTSSDLLARLGGAATPLID